MNAWKRVIRFIGVVVGFAMRRRRLSVAVVIVALLVVPLALTGNGEVFVLNALGLGIAVLIVQRLTRFGGGRTWRSVDGSDEQQGPSYATHERRYGVQFAGLGDTGRSSWRWWRWRSCSRPCCCESRK